MAVNEFDPLIKDSSSEDNSLDWAREAYARLKKQQESDKAERLATEEKESPISENSNIDTYAINSSNDFPNLEIFSIIFGGIVIISQLQFFA